MGAVPPMPGSFNQFQIPLFLLPIYQAAAIQYDVPWQLLAAINQVETNFGSDLSVSSAGAEGWMQFMPSTWSQYGLDISNEGAANPYDPADAIFAAARYLHAAGAAHDLRGAIFAYNHSAAYVGTVLGDAGRIERVPAPIIAALTGMSSGLFPVHAPATYRDVADPSPAGPYTDIASRSGAPVLASETGRIIAVGRSRRLGRFVTLRDAYGTTYTYGDLGSVARAYPVPGAGTRTASRLVHVYRAATLVAPVAPRGVGVARGSAGPAAPPVAAAPAPPVGAAPAPPASAAPAPPTGNPLATGTFTATLTSTSTATGPAGPQLDPVPPVRYAPSGRSTLGFGGPGVRWRALRPGAVVVAGTVLGHLGGATHGPPHLRFTIRAVAARGPLVDPGPMLDAWRLLERAPINAVAHPQVGQALLMSQPALAAAVLSDSRVRLHGRLRGEVARGQIDHRVLAALEILAGAGLRPTATDASAAGSAVGVGALAAGDAATITALNGVPLRNHRRSGALVEAAVLRLGTLQGDLEPSLIASRATLPDADNAVARRAAMNEIDVAFAPRFGPDRGLERAAVDALGVAAPGGGVWTSAFGGGIVAPQGVPAAVGAIISAGNAIATLPYIWGGGHGSFQAPGYDCSGSVSYALAAAGLLSAPMVSGDFENWGMPGPGRWVTIYANADHVWMSVAGWRFDTVALAEAGSRWARSGGEFAGFVVRHPPGM